MRRVIQGIIGSAVIALVLAPATARAEGYVSPFMGVNFGNNSGDGRSSFGVNAGWMGKGIIGGEVDFGFAPSFFGNAGTFGNNSVTDFMGNVIVGVPIGGTSGSGAKPYGTIGVGVIRSKITLPETADTELGMNAGAGVMGFLSSHVGIRGDVRYFRNLQGERASNIDFGAFHFWRASFGVVLR
jgi:hypothetical protein